jgi:class 3 adenylate cyclase
MSQTRRLAAILAADVVGYSRLMGVNEVGTLDRLMAVRRELVAPSLVEHRGRIVKTTGDGMLVEFASVVEGKKWVQELLTLFPGAAILRMRRGPTNVYAGAWGTALLEGLRKTGPPEE